MDEQQCHGGPLVPRIVAVIVDSDKCDRVKEIVTDSFFLWAYVINCVGTAKSELLDLLGLGEAEKSLLVFFEPGFRAWEIVRKLSDRLELDKPGNGIAFMIPISGLTQVTSKMFSEERIVKIAEALGESEKIRVMNMLRQVREFPGGQGKLGQEERERMKGYMDKELEKPQEVGLKYDMILAVVNQGYSDELMDAARAAGAGGGSVIQARRSGREDTVKFFGISLQEEKEIVAILTKRENRKDIMKAINHACGFATRASGIIFSVPVDGVAGIGNK